MDSNVRLAIKTGEKISETEYIGAPTITLCYNSVYLSKRLAELGMIKTKTFLISLPNFIPNNLMKHFIRGYFDGDGCVTMSRSKIKASMVSNCGFIGQLYDFLKNIGIHSSKGKDKDTKINQLYFQGENCRKFLDYLYSDATIYLSRKYNRYFRYYYGDGIIEKYKKLSNDELLEKYGYD